MADVLKRAWTVLIGLVLITPIVALTPAQAAEPTSVTIAELTLADRPVDLPSELALDVPTPAGTRLTPKVTPDVTQQVWQVAEVPVDAHIGVVGVTWAADAPTPEVFVRVIHDGVEGEWSRLGSHDDPEPENPSASAGTDPLLLVDASAVQVATLAAEPVEAELQVHASAATAPDKDLAWRNPDILSRAAWGADESIVRLPYLYRQVTGAMIHYTAGSNTYQPEDVPAILRSIQAYHVNGRGWKDIAYNFLVDRFGRAWEGRGGGVDKAVEGGHAYGVTNARVFGISLMGTYDGSVQPPAEAIDTVQRVIAWKFLLHGVDPLGTTWGSGGQSGGDTFLHAISGHRDESNTLCPGENVYSQMDQIRLAVKALMDESAATPPAIKATGKPKVTGTHAVGKTLKASTSGVTWNVTGVKKAYRWLVKGKQVSTSSSYTIKAADAGRSVQLVVTGSKAGHKSATTKSAKKNVTKLASKTTLSVGKLKAKKVGSATVTVKASGLKPKGTVRVYANGKRVATGKLNSKGKVKVKLPKRAKGTVKLKASYLGNSQIKSSKSAVKKVKVQ